MITLSRMSTVSKFAALAVLLSLSMPTAGIAGSNPLIGNWKFTDTTQGPNAVPCSTSYVFADKMMTVVSPPSSVIPNATTRNMVVNYISASPKLVAVATDGGIINYDLSDNNHMTIAGPWGKCNYVRTN